MDGTLNPGSRPRRGALFALAAVGAAAIVGGAVIVGTPDDAEASGLEAFASCAEMEAWASSSAGFGGGDEEFVEVGGPVSTMAGDADGAAAGFRMGVDEATSSAPAANDAVAAEQSSASGGATGATNVIVEGVDEFDLVDRLDGDRVLVASAERLAIVDLAAGEIVASREIPYDATISYDPDRGIAWVVGGVGNVGIGFDGPAIDVAPGFVGRGPAMSSMIAPLGVRVERVAVGGASIESEGTWESEGMLVAARRVGAELHLVASDGFSGVGGDALPFGGATVPCDEVLHPLGPSEPTASLIATFPASGAVDPVRATQVVGSGSNVHVTLDAAYVATPLWQDDVVRTGIHRFDLGSLAHTGSGTVDGSILNDFSISEHDGHLRVAVTAAGGGFIGIPEPMPMPVEPMPDPVEPMPDPVEPMPLPEPMPTEPDVVPVEPDALPAEPDAVPNDLGAELDDGDGAVTSQEAVVPQAAPSSSLPSDPGAPDPSVPDGTDPEPTVPEATVPETTVPETTVPETTSPETTTPETTEPAPEPEPEPQPGPDDPLNQVVVLDIEGDLDVVGRTPRFGKPGETIHGVRFDGNVAYAVTFLQTDPFYVLDLSDPTAPTIEGEVELPGFSSYLHPVGDGSVVGFGPGGDGRAAAKLFDVSDPTEPRVADDIVLGDDSPVSYDHHAFVDLGDGRFAVPASSWSSTFPERCTPAVREDAQDREAAIQAELAGPDGDYSLQGERAEELYRELDQLNIEGCLYPGTTTDSSVVVLEVQGDRLVEVDRVTVNLGQLASRVVPADGGWALLAGSQVGLVDAGGDLRTTLDLLG